MDLIFVLIFSLFHKDKEVIVDIPLFIATTQVFSQGMLQDSKFEDGIVVTEKASYRNQHGC